MDEEKEKLLEETWATTLAILRIASSFYDKNLPHLEATEGAVRKLHLAWVEARAELWHEKKKTEQVREGLLIRVRRLRRKRRKLRNILSGVFDIFEEHLNGKG